MSRSKYILFALLLSLSLGTFAQKAERDYIRKGNRLFKDSVFVDAEVNYRKALEVNPKSIVSMYNLGNTLSQQQKFKDAMEQYVAATQIEKIRPSWDRFIIIWEYYSSLVKIIRKRLKHIRCL